MLLIVAFILYWAWTFFSCEAIIRNYIITKIDEAAGEDFHYESLRLRPMGFDLKKIDYSPATYNSEGHLFQAEKISIELGIWDLIWRFLGPEHPFLRLALLNPTITLSPDILTSLTKSHQLSSFVQPALQKSIQADTSIFLQKLKSVDLSFIKMLGINNGTIIQRDSRTNIPYAENINGWIRQDRWVQTNIKLSGKILKLNNAQLTVSANVNLQDVSLDSFQVKIKGYRYKGSLPISLPGKTLMENGSLDGTLTLSMNNLQKGIRFRGDLKLINGRFVSYIRKNDLKTLLRKPPPSFIRIVIDSVNTNIKFDQDKLEITHSRKLINTQPIEINGNLQLADLSSLFTSGDGVFFSLAKLIDSNKESLNHNENADSIALTDYGVNLYFKSEALILEKFFQPLLRTLGLNGKSTSSIQPPFSGVVQLNGWVNGHLHSPNLSVTIVSPEVNVYGKALKNVYTKIFYNNSLSGTVRKQHSSHDLYWEGRGILSLNGQDKKSSLKTIDKENDKIKWQGWGNINLNQKQLPLDLTIVSDGDLRSVLSKIPVLNKTDFKGSFNRLTNGRHKDTYSVNQILHDKLPVIKITSVSRITGPLLKPVLNGKLNFDIENKRDATNRWLGKFSLRDDILKLDINMSGETSALRAEIRRFGKKPLFKVEGLHAQILPSILGKKTARSILDNLDIDLYLEGHTDSLNIRVEGRNKKNGKNLFQLIGYMVPLLQGERVTSGYVKFFPGGKNEFTTRFTCHWQDGLLTLSDLHSDDWLTGSLQLNTKGNRKIRGKLRISGAELSDLVEGIHLEHPRYKGKFFGDLKISGTLDDPELVTKFWLFDGFFNDVGNFSLNGNFNMDRSGWQTDSLVITRNYEPYLNASFRYNSNDKKLLLQTSAQDIDGKEFLQALAKVPPKAFKGRLTFDLRAEGPASHFQQEKGIPLTGQLSARKGSVTWFQFDTLHVNLDTNQRDSQLATIARGGLSLQDVLYIKEPSDKNEEGFRMSGKAFLPFNKTTDLNISIEGAGNFLAVLPDITSFFTKANSKGVLSLNIRGPYTKPILYNSHLNFKDGTLAMSQVAPEIKSLSGEAFIDSRGTFIDIINLSGQVDDDSILVRNIETVQPLMFAGATARLKNITPVQPLQIGKSGLHLGTLLMKSGKKGLHLNIPGLMKAGDVGRFVISGQVDTTFWWGDDDQFTITGPWSHPKLQGRVVMEDVSFQFPFNESNSAVDPVITQVLHNINWDVVVESKKNNRYVMAIPRALTDVYVNLDIDDSASRLRFVGILSDSSLYIDGAARSTRGIIEYLDLNFRVNEFGADFDRSDWWPVVYGSAETVFTDSTNFPYNVYMTLHTTDPLTGQERAQGRFDDVYFKLTSDHPSLTGLTQEQILAFLGYSVDNISENATEFVAHSTYDRLLRPYIIRPIERRLERTLGLDVVRFSSNFARNYLVSKFNPTVEQQSINDEESALSLLRNSRLTIGKYLTNKFYVLYVGQVESAEDYSSIGLSKDYTLPIYESSLQFRHRLGLEYRLNTAMLLHFEYDYNPFGIIEKVDRKLWIRHTFPIDFFSNLQ